MILVYGGGRIGMVRPSICPALLRATDWVGVKATARAGKISGMVVHRHARDHAETLELHLNGCTLRHDASSACAAIGSFAARTTAFVCGPGAAFDVALPITHPNELRMLGVSEPEVASGEYSGTIMKLRQLSPPVSSPVEVLVFGRFQRQTSGVTGC